MSSCSSAEAVRGPGAVRSSSQLSQSGVSAIAEGAGTSSRSARSRTSRYRSGAASSAIGTVGLRAGLARATTSGDAGGQQQHEHGEPASRPSGRRPSRCTAETAGGPAGEQHHGDGRGQQRDGQRPAADAQHGEGPGARGLRACFHTAYRSGSRPDLTPSARCPDGCVAHSPTVAPATDIAMPVGQVPERLRRTLVGARPAVSRIGQRSLDGMALGRGG